MFDTPCLGLLPGRLVGYWRSLTPQNPLLLLCIVFPRIPWSMLRCPWQFFKCHLGSGNYTDPSSLYMSNLYPMPQARSGAAVLVFANCCASRCKMTIHSHLERDFLALQGIGHTLTLFSPRLLLYARDPNLHMAAILLCFKVEKFSQVQKHQDLGLMGDPVSETWNRQGERKSRVLWGHMRHCKGSSDASEEEAPGLPRAAQGETNIWR